jgi:hypothetical protein
MGFEWNRAVADTKFPSLHGGFVSPHWGQWIVLQAQLPFMVAVFLVCEVKL